jgi:hypothetical protein
MLKAIIKNRIGAMERRYGYDATYVKAIVDADLRAFRKLARAMGMGDYMKDLPKAAFYAAKVVGAMHEDCGPCTQLCVVMAERAGVPAAVLRAVVEGDDPALPADVRRVVRFARAILSRARESSRGLEAASSPPAHDLAADEDRDWIRAQWGERALISIAFALAMSRVYPTIKYTLGYGRACSKIVVAGTPLVPVGRVDPLATSAVVHA